MPAAHTIVALSSGAPPAGVAVIRISGPEAIAVLEKLTGSIGPPRQMHLRTIRDPGTSEAIDRVLAVHFAGPHSFTGEDSAELHCHGSRAVVERVLELIAKLEGCRLAEAGEFTRRAFENGRLDLTQVEGIGDLIAAQTQAQRRQAARRTEGELAKALESWRAQIVKLRAEVEARLDFADEGDVAPALPAGMADELAALVRQISAILDNYSGGRLVREGVRVALTGAPNAGKSTLMNRLARSEVAIVTEVPGTTRDVIEVPLNVDGYLFLVADTAGVRPTDDRVEAEGVRRAQARIADSDLVIELIAPDSDDIPVEVPAGVELWRVGSKADLGEASVPGLVMEISALAGDGMDILKAALTQFAERHTSGEEAALVSHARDREHLERAAAALDGARDRLAAPELLAEELRQASDALGRLTGAVDAEEVLDAIFAGFCIGK